LPPFHSILMPEQDSAPHHVGHNDAAVQDYMPRRSLQRSSPEF
jgi:hypothetical protein